MSESSGHRQLTLLQDASLWDTQCEARSEHSLYLSDRASGGDAPLSRYRDYLGHEFFQVWIDCRNGLHADAITALGGTVIAGGLLCILLPAQDNPMSQRMQRFATRCFGSAWRDTPAHSTPSAPESAPVFRLTPDQKRTLTTIQNPSSPPKTHIITAERGRGKSTLLGHALGTLSPDTPVIVTAPRKANIQQLLKQAPNAQFVAWDKLLAHPQEQRTLLIIDEAAGLPLWATERLCEQFQPWLLATTVAGYEGCGRGFAVHFTRWAERHLSQVHFHTLNKALRWPDDDPLERWLRHTFLLDEKPVTRSTGTADGIFVQHASELDEQQLQSCFQLLLNAHYQSSPNDLNLLLTQRDHYLAYEIRHSSVRAVAWLMSEGPIANALKNDIQAGLRRPKGNLLPQTVGYHLQQRWALDKRWLRVARIAVPPANRREYAASSLLSRIADWAVQHDYHMLGTSFAWSPALDQFWQRNQYHPWRFSSRIDSVSARPAALYARPLSAAQLGSVGQTLNRWGHNQQRWLAGEPSALYYSDDLKRIGTAILSAYQEQRLPFDAAHFALAQWFFNNDHRSELATLICQPHTTLKTLGRHWNGLSKRDASENLCKELRSRR